MTAGDHQVLIQALDECGLEYEILSCDPELADTDIFCKHYGWALEDCANTILVKAKSQQERFVACVLLASTRLDVNKVVRKKLQVRRASFASGEETQRITGMTIGGVTPVGLPAGLPLWIDAQVMERPFIILGGASRSAKIKISPDLFHLTANSEIVEGLARPF